MFRPSIQENTRTKIPCEVNHKKLNSPFKPTHTRPQRASSNIFNQTIVEHHIVDEAITTTNAVSNPEHNVQFSSYVKKSLLLEFQIHH